jgi:hypothetical protein
MEQLTQAQALAMHDGGEWRDWTDEEIARFQLQQERLCIPFARFHAAVEAALKRPVFTHEFIDSVRLLAELDA